ncbi:MAG: hypothetical protein AAF222_14755, partial [Pseudomonadota bacterium]
NGETQRFAAWRVLERDERQVLLEVSGTPIRTWLAIDALLIGGGTRLFFGSALVPQTGTSGLGWGLRATIPGHRVYSRMLLNAAAGTLSHKPGEPVTKAEG